MQIIWDETKIQDTVGCGVEITTSGWGVLNFLTRRVKLRYSFEFLLPQFCSMDRLLLFFFLYFLVAFTRALALATFVLQ